MQSTLLSVVKNDKVYLFKGTDSSPQWISAYDEGDVVSISITSDGEYIAVGTDSSSYGYLYLFDKDWRLNQFGLMIL